MAMTLRRTVLDAELSRMAREVSERPDRRATPFEILGAARARLAEVAPEARVERSTIKLMPGQQQHEEAERWIAQVGGELLSRGPGAVVATLPLSAIGDLDACDWVRRAEAARPLLPRLDQARGSVTGLDTALGVHPLTGDGVMVGIVDSGADWSHQDFQHKDGTTRLELFSHAFRPQGSHVSQFDEFTRQQIDDALQGQAAVPQGDPHGHGTHCLSIAAGNGNASAGSLRGVAPDAALVAVRSEPLLDTHTIYGIRRVFEMAGDRPAVVTLSLGGHWGAHDGTSAIENVIAQESGPGRIVVVAAGNEGSDAIHWEGQLAAGQELSIPVRIGDTDLQFVDVWIPRADQVDVSIEAPDGSRVDADGQERTTVFGTFAAEPRIDPINRDQNITLFVAGGRVNHVWRIVITPTSVTDGRVHAWAGTADPSTSAHLFPGAQSPAYSVGMPGTEERAIVVGSLVSRTSFPVAGGTLTAQALSVGQLSSFSSRGPTRYGALKPDVAAPGQYVTAALASNSVLETDPAYVGRHHPSHRYITIQGTSMATPFVAGLVALLLEREPTLNPEQVQQRLRTTARRDADTGATWNDGFGFGKLDAEALLDYQA
jgi:subtilisin family serine protease